MPELQQVPIDHIGRLENKQINEVKKLGISNVYDLLTWFPYKYKEIDPFTVDVQDHRSDALINGRLINIQVKKRDNQPVYAKPCSNGCFQLYFSAEVINDSGQVKFNQTSNQEIPVQVNFYTYRLNVYKDILKNYDHFKICGRYKSLDSSINVYDYQGSIKPFKYKKPRKIVLLGQYHTKNHVKQSTIRKSINMAYIQFNEELNEVASDTIRQESNLMTRDEAIFSIHFPESIRKKDSAIYTEKFNELYKYELRLQKLNANRKHKTGFKIDYKQNILDSFKNRLPFTLTDDQINAKKDILIDLSQPYKMHRLLQGDVGSGKTVVSAFGILATITSGYQAALMTPTAVLSEQHYESFKKRFKYFGLTVDILNGKSSAAHKRDVLERVRTGETDLLIGTHSLFQKRVKYHNLGLAVVDEQQLFGVNQRKAFANKTKGCNVLSLTATPIPRTLATSLYGGMDSSIINHLPRGRKPIKTKWLEKITNKALKDVIDKAISENGRVFIVTKLVKPSESWKVTDTFTMKYKLSKILDPNYNVENLYGKMQPNIKEQVIRDFRSGKCKVLVATTVVGVGMDISNANLMIIYDAQVYGLAQLHQLRGRVGRNNKQAWCVLIGSPHSENGAKRLKAMEKTTDGFKLSRIDLQMRHSGNLFGKMQHGLPEFKLANLEEINDVDILTQAQKKASQVVRDDWIDN